MWLKISTSQYTPPWIFDSPIVALNALWNCASYGWPRGLEQTSQVVFWWLKRRKRMFTMWPWWGSIRTCHHFVSQILDDFWLLSNCGIAAQYLLSNHIPWIFHVYLLSNHIPWIFHVIMWPIVFRIWIQHTDTLYDLRVSTDFIYLQKVFIIPMISYLSSAS